MGRATKFPKRSNAIERTLACEQSFDSRSEGRFTGILPAEEGFRSVHPAKRHVTCDQAFSAALRDRVSNGKVFTSGRIYLPIIRIFNRQRGYVSQLRRCWNRATRAASRTGHRRPGSRMPD